ncbi:hypothetical protein PO878_10980 [Iamia majanohamensis]|uniref:Uncharacterized protein n=1 Tax=Iamia majanohamensis TaxID=467976 RepID=A0AAE9Y333_9ACTN|nr:hypothetical protein [Iamia majanohamensis]WCO65022.1 hypothetical protein PO878_10980 [Iamia majanohamensis]
MPPCLAARRLLSKLERVKWESLLAERWVSIVDRAGYGTPDLVHGCQLQRCDRAVDGARYVVKEQEPRAGLSSRPVLELLRGDLKQARKGLTP